MRRTRRGPRAPGPGTRSPHAVASWRGGAEVLAPAVPGAQGAAEDQDRSPWNRRWGRCARGETAACCSPPRGLRRGRTAPPPCRSVPLLLRSSRPGGRRLPSRTPPGRCPSPARSTRNEGGCAEHRGGLLAGVQRVALSPLAQSFASGQEAELRERPEAGAAGAPLPPSGPGVQLGSPDGNRSCRSGASRGRSRCGARTSGAHAILSLPVHPRVPRTCRLRGRGGCHSVNSYRLIGRRRNLMRGPLSVVIRYFLGD